MINQRDFKSILQFNFNENMGSLVVGLTEVSSENEKYLELIEMTLHNYISNREWDISFNGRGKLYIGDQEEGFIEVELRNKVFPHSEFGDSVTNELFRFEVKRLLVECFHNLINENSDDLELTDDFIENFEVLFNLQLKTIDGIVLPKDVKLDCLKNDVQITSEQSIQIAERIYSAVKSDATGAIFLTLGGDNTEIEFQGLSGEVEVFEYSVSPITIEIR
jgi:hypothetical protein